MSGHSGFPDMNVSSIEGIGTLLSLIDVLLVSIVCRSSYGVLEFSFCPVDDRIVSS